MNLHDLLDLDLDTHLTVSTEVFTLAAKLFVKMEDGVKHTWMFADEELLLSVNPDAEEIMLFSAVETNVDKDDEVIVLQGKDYEFSYEDRGGVISAEGDSPYDEGADIEYSDYEAGDGDVVRMITNIYNGEEKTFVGRVITEEDIVMVVD